MILDPYHKQKERVLHKCWTTAKERNHHDDERRDEDNVDPNEVLLEFQSPHPFVEPRFDTYP